MTNQLALEILRAQGYAVSSPGHDGEVRIWLHGNNDAVTVKPGRELHELAEGKLNLGEIRERREDEVLIED